MTRSIISKFIITLIVLFTALSIFWFFKTSAIKKQVLAMISSSGGTVSAASVSVAGFPLEQKLSIDDLKIQLALLNPLPSLPTTLIPNNKYQIQIKKLEASASIFSGDFAITNFGEASFQDQNGTSSVVQFNQAPKANFSVSGGDLVKFSYQDSGYKIVDAAKNVLFENGNSAVNFDSVIEGNKYHNKVKAEFKDVGALSFANEVTNNPVATPAADPVKDPNAAPANVAAAETAKPAAETQAVSNNLIKKTVVLELEYVVAKPSIGAAPVPNPESQNTATSDIAPVTEKAVESLSIKNFEIASPLYKLNINGEITSFQKDALPICSISVRIEKLDNVLTYIKKSITNLPNVNNPNKVDNITDVANNPAIGAAAISTSDSATAPASNQKPEVDLSVIIKDLSRKNVATNEEIAVFDFRQEQGKDLLINETSLSEIMSQIFVTSAANSGNAKPAEGDNVNTANDSASINKVAVPAPAPTPAKITIPAKPKNAN
ncbi:MAG: hypothetical protein V4612_02055 [Pseudomonadota bacterium]